jgi:hypothetical protein
MYYLLIIFNPGRFAFFLVLPLRENRKNKYTNKNKKQNKVNTPNKR